MGFITPSSATGLFPRERDSAKLKNNYYKKYEKNNASIATSLFHFMVTNKSISDDFSSRSVCGNSRNTPLTFLFVYVISQQLVFFCETVFLSIINGLFRIN